MAMHAIFRFENLDSTRDLNSRFEGLFKRGIYDGGSVEIVGSSVKVSKFKAITEDGMAVISDDDIIVPIPSTRNSYYIILNAKYVIDGDPIIEVRAVDVTAIGNYDSPVKFAMFSNNTINTNNIDYRDVVDAVGKNYYKGQFTLDNYPKENLFAGDWFFVKEGENYKIYLYNGSGYSSFESVTEVTDSLSFHRNNVIKDISNSLNSNDTGYWNHPIIDSTTPVSEDIAKNQEYGSYHISINKWFASENILRKWTKPANSDWVKQDTTISKCKDYADTLENFGVSWTDENLTVTLDQVPSNTNKFITQNYPLLPTASEKYAIAGNLTGIKQGNSLKYPVGLDNKLVSQKTAGVSIMSVAVDSTIETRVSTYYYYALNLNSTSSHIYVGRGVSAEEWLRYFKISTISDYSTKSLSTLSICTKIGDSFNELTDSDFVAASDSDRCAGRGFLKNSVVYYIKSPIQLQGAIYYYVESDIDSIDYAPLSDNYVRNLLQVDKLDTSSLNINTTTGVSSYVIEQGDAASTLSIKQSINYTSKRTILDISIVADNGYYSKLSLHRFVENPPQQRKSISGSLFINADGDLMFEHSDGNTYKVFLVK